MHGTTVKINLLLYVLHFKRENFKKHFSMIVTFFPISNVCTYISLVKFTLHIELHLLLDLSYSQRFFMPKFVKFKHTFCNAVSKYVLQQETEDGGTDIRTNTPDHGKVHSINVLQPVKY